MITKTIEEVATQALEDTKAFDVVSLDVRELTNLADKMLICTGRSSQHVKSLAEHVREAAKKHQHKFINVEGKEVGEWVIVDLGDIIVHIMTAESREYYKLEDLWEPLKKIRKAKS